MRRLLAEYPAHRLHDPADRAEAMRLEPAVRFDEAQPESHWDEFSADIAILVPPSAARRRIRGFP